jgi:signal transduction histidine kinase
VKFTPSGGRVTIRSYNADAVSLDGGPSPTTSSKRLFDESVRMLFVSVQDTGIGIDPAVLPRLFSAFEQGDDNVGRVFGGLGLGLNISQVQKLFRNI